MRQYIGARYMPKFMGLYDATTAYEALSVVDNGMGTSYVSNKPVPVGTPLSDTNYWSIYGASSGAILDLQNKVQNIKKGGDLIIVAASYGLYPSATDNFIVYLKQLLANVYDNIYDGSTAAASFGNGALLTTLQNINVDEPNNVSDIIVVGYSNDSNTSESDLVTAMTNFRIYCNNNYPFAHVSLAPVSGRGFPNDAIPAFTAYQRMVNHIVDHGISIMTKLFHVVMLNYKIYLQADNLHPTTAGAKLIAEAIYNYLVHGDYNKQIISNENISDHLLFNSNVTPIGPPYLFYDEVAIDLNRVDIAIRLTVEMINSDYIPSSWNVFRLCTANKLLAGPETDTYKLLKCVPGTVTDMSDNTHYPINFNIVYHDGNYWYTVKTEAVTDIILTAGHQYSFKCRGSYPFYLN